MLPFDPIALRDFWLKVRLPYVMNAAPLNHEEPRVTHISRVSYAVVQASGFVNGYFVGLWNELLPKVEKHIRWMESEPEPEPSVYREHGLTEEGWRDEVFVWRQTLGLCKWLGRGDRAFSDLTAAAAADWQMLELASPALASQARATRCNFMSIHLATALAAGSPLIGLKIQEAAHMKSPMEPMTSPIRFGLWACQHLVDGGRCDETFVSRGRDMLTANLIPKFYHGAQLFEAAIWLKAIYFDSGVVQTPEQAFVKAYDSMPGVARPDFMSASGASSRQLPRSHGPRAS